MTHASTSIQQACLRRALCHFFVSAYCVYFFFWDSLSAAHSVSSSPGSLHPFIHMFICLSVPVIDYFCGFCSMHVSCCQTARSDGSCQWNWRLMKLVASVSRSGLWNRYHHWKYTRWVRETIHLSSVGSLLHPYKAASKHIKHLRKRPSCFVFVVCSFPC